MTRFKDMRMPRKPKPWFWKARNAWYIQINGKQVKLHEDKKEAEQEWHRLMAANGQLDDRTRKKITFADACESYLCNYQHNRKGTIRNATDKLSDLAAVFGHRRLDSLQPNEVLAWIAVYQGRTKKPVGDATRALLFRWCKQLYRWCRDTGLIDIDPFVRAQCPWKIRAREAVMTDEEYVLVMSLPRLSAAFKQVVEFIWRTGIRPGELAILSARHMDSREKIIRFQPTEHKTGTRTGLQREVHMPADLWERLKTYAERHRQGPLLRKTNGNPWSSREITEVFRKVKVRHGLKCVLYQARHRYGTTLLEAGVDIHLAAKMMGHSTIKQLYSTYYHPDMKSMAEATERIMGAEAEAARMKQIAEAVAKRKEEMKAKQKAADREKHRRLYHAKKPKPDAPSDT